jgi:hypothetical protein
MESADLCCSKWLWRGSQHTAQALPPILGTNIARSNTLEIVAFNICFFFLLFFIFYVIDKLYNGAQTFMRKYVLLCSHFFHLNPVVSPGCEGAP